MAKKWKVINGKRVTFAMIEAAARAAHEANYIERGDRYATAEEMEMHRNDPLACAELVGEAVAATFGFDEYFDFRDAVVRPLWSARLI